MASEMPPTATATASDSVQCPVCSKDFQSDMINGHLDVCLLKGDTDTENGVPTAPDGSGPPGKKFRVETAHLNPPVKNSAVVSSAGAPSFSLFSKFKANKTNVSPRGERNTLFPSMQTGGTVANKGFKRSLLSEDGPTGVEHLESQPSVSSGQTLKATHDVSPVSKMDKPLAETLRPNTLDEYFGQSKVVGEQTLLRSLLESQEIPSLILWGPPGCGKVQI